MSYLFKNGTLVKKSFNGHSSHSKKFNADHLHLETAGNLIYSALQDPKCAEVRGVMEHYLNDHKRNIHIQEIYDDFHKSVLHQLKYPKERRSLLHGGAEGGSSLKACMLAGFMILFISLTMFLMNVHAETTHYKMHCADIMELLNTNTRSSRVETFFDHIHKLNNMIFNRHQLEHCKKLRDKQGAYMFEFVESIHSTTKDFTTILKTVGSVVVFLITILSSGVKGLVCLAAKFVNDSEICGVECDKLNIKLPSPAAAAAAKSKSKSKSKSPVAAEAAAMGSEEQQEE